MIRPSRVIKRHNGEPYLRRWHIIPRNRWFNIYLHHFVGSDDERATHDHPWPSVSIKLAGYLDEIWTEPLNGGLRLAHRRTIEWLWPYYRSPEFSHRLIVPEGETAWTLFITGPRVRSWGFHCAKGWRHWRDYEANGGCDD